MPVPQQQKKLQGTYSATTLVKNVVEDNGSIGTFTLHMHVGQPHSPIKDASSEERRVSRVNSYICKPTLLSCLGQDFISGLQVSFQGGQADQVK